MDSFQKPDEIEIDLSELLFFCLKRWRRIICFMVIFGLLFGIYQIVHTEADAAAGETSGSESDLTQVKDGVVEYLSDGIAQKEAYLEELLEYMETSDIMNMDPYNVDTAYVTCYVKAQEGQSASTLSEAYEALVENGGLAQILLEADDSLDETDLNYLISYSSSDSGLDDDSTLSELFGNGTIESVFTISVAAADASAAESYVEVLQAAVEDYAQEVTESIGAHTLTLIDAGCTTEINDTIYTYQSNIRTKYATTLTELQTLRTNYSTAIDDMDTESESSDDMLSPAEKGIRYGLIGVLTGLVAALIVLILQYLLGGRLHSLSGFKETYGLILLGKITKLEEKKRRAGVIDRLIAQLKEGAYYTMTCEEQAKIAAENIRAAAHSAGVSRLMVAGSLQAQEAADLYDLLAEQLKGLPGLSAAQAENAAAERADGLDGLSAERAGASAECGGAAAEQAERLDKLSAAQAERLDGLSAERAGASEAQPDKLSAAHAEGLQISAYARIVFNADALGEMSSYDGIIFLEKQDVSYKKLMDEERSLAAARGIRILGAVVA